MPDPVANSHLRVYHGLKAMLVGYQFRPGEQLIIGELADRLRVSATPVRENLIRLHAEGLVDISRHRGFFVKALTLDEMCDVLRFRHVVLKGAIEMGAKSDFAKQFTHRATYPVADEVNNKYSSDANAIAREVEHGLESIALIGGEAMLASVRNANERTHFLRTIQIESAADVSAFVTNTTRLRAAVAAGDKEQAIDLLLADLQSSLRNMPHLIREGIARIYQSAWKAGPQSGVLSGLIQQ